MNEQVKDVDLRGQVAIVTGGGRGIGREIAQALATAHAQVVVVARTTEQLAETVKLINETGGQCTSIVTDVADPQAVQNMVQRIEIEIGPVSVLINNAGFLGTVGPIWELDPAEWLRVIDINLNGALLCARAVLPGMVQRRQGRIINVSSGAALAPIPFGTAYCVSKAALVRFTECMAVETYEHGVFAFAIDPGFVRTEMSRYLGESEEAKLYLPWINHLWVEGRFDPAERATELVVRLASGEADALTGRFVRIYDDLDAMLLHAAQIDKDDLYTLRVGTLSTEP